MENGPFMDDVPSYNLHLYGIFHGYVSHNQMVTFSNVAIINQRRQGTVEVATEAANALALATALPLQLQRRRRQLGCSTCGDWGEW
jgi:hypothetical protein